MKVAKQVNDVLDKMLGMRIIRSSTKVGVSKPELKKRKKKPFSYRRLHEPAFVFSSVRSGSTLLSSILNSHTEIYSPNETQFTGLTVKTTTDQKSIVRGMSDFGLSLKDARYLLWDEILARALKNSGKKVIVEKTPRNVLHWQKVTECWPNAKIIFLIRHPYSIAQSWIEAKNCTDDEAYEKVKQFASAIEDARKNASQESITVKYEEITENPEESIRKICDFLNVDFEEEMLNYGSSSYNKNTKKTIGDRGKKMKTGKIQSGRALPDKNDIPKPLLEIARSWDYVK